MSKHPTPLDNLDLPPNVRSILEALMGKAEEWESILQTVVVAAKRAKMEELRGAFVNERAFVLAAICEATGVLQGSQTGECVSGLLGRYESTLVLSENCDLGEQSQS